MNNGMCFFFWKHSSHNRGCGVAAEPITAEQVSPEATRWEYSMPQPPRFSGQYAEQKLRFGSSCVKLCIFVKSPEAIGRKRQLPKRLYRLRGIFISEPFKGFCDQSKQPACRKSGRHPCRPCPGIARKPPGTRAILDYFLEPKNVMSCTTNCGTFRKAPDSSLYSLS